jgi:hypothetical protein
MTTQDVRRMALALPETTEAPHHDRTSFRVGGRIFATVPPDGDSVNVMLGEEKARAAADDAPGEVELLWWGKRLSGVRIALAGADPALVAELLEEGWRRRAPSAVVAAHEAGHTAQDAAREPPA